MMYFESDGSYIGDFAKLQIVWCKTTGFELPLGTTPAEVGLVGFRPFGADPGRK